MTNSDFVNNSALFSNKREQRVVFFLVFMGVLSLTYGFFFAIDFLPEKPGTEDAASVREETALPLQEAVASAVVTESISDEPREVSRGESVQPENPTQPIEHTTSTIPPGADALPVKIIFDTLNREVPILNPQSASIAALDNALLSGVIRHPDSGDFQNEGTIFLLGHSSYLPNVINKNFQAFNGIQKLTWGDTIRLRSTDTEYVYRVDRVYQTKATGAEIKIEQGEPKLTLATCNSFGTKDDRYVVEATLLESHPL